MRTLTEHQAAVLRELRPTIRPVVGSLAALGTALRTDSVDPHEDYVTGCPACELEILTTTAERAVQSLADQIDFHLSRGPVPKVKT